MLLILACFQDKRDAFLHRHEDQHWLRLVLRPVLLVFGYSMLLFFTYILTETSKSLFVPGAFRETNPAKSISHPFYEDIDHPLATAETVKKCESKERTSPNGLLAIKNKFITLERKRIEGGVQRNHSHNANTQVHPLSKINSPCT